MAIVDHLSCTGDWRRPLAAAGRALMLACHVSSSREPIPKACLISAADGEGLYVFVCVCVCVCCERKLLLKFDIFNLPVKATDLRSIFSSICAALGWRVSRKFKVTYK